MQSRIGARSVITREVGKYDSNTCTERLGRALEATEHTLEFANTRTPTVLLFNEAMEDF